MSAKTSDDRLVGPIRLKLPYDILLEMLNHIGDRQTLSRYMRTCKTMHKSGIAPLLRFCVDLGNDGIVSFSLFMLADLTRCNNIRQLSLFMDDLCQISVGDVLPAIIQHAKRLEELTVTTFLFETCLNLGPAVAAAESITQLYIHGGPSFDLPRWMPVIRSPIREVTLSHSDRGTHCAREDREIDLVSVVSAVSDTLEVLKVSHASWYAPHAPVTFPLLHTLALYDADSDETAVLFELAPNLKRLHIEGNDSRDISEEDEDIRASNLSEQEERGTWPSLDRVEMLFYDHYAMGIRCHIRELYVRQVFLEMYKPCHYRAVVEAAQPECLTAHIYIDERIDLTNVPPIIHSTPASVVRFNLDLIAPCDLPAEEYVDLLVQSLGHCKTLAHLTLFLDSRESMEESSPSCPELVARDPDYVKQLLNGALAKRIANLLPRIHYICIHLALSCLDIPCRPGIREYWEIERCQDEVVMKQLTLSEGRAAMEHTTP